MGVTTTGVVVLVEEIVAAGTAIADDGQPDWRESSLRTSSRIISRNRGWSSNWGEGPTTSTSSTSTPLADSLGHHKGLLRIARTIAKDDKRQEK